MNSDTLAGDARNFGGQIKEAAGNATGDDTLAAQGATDQLSGTLQKGIGQARDAAAPMIDQARKFAKERPWATAALAGVVGMALLNTLRGR